MFIEATEHVSTFATCEEADSKNLKMHVYMRSSVQEQSVSEMKQNENIVNIQGWKQRLIILGNTDVNPIGKAFLSHCRQLEIGGYSFGSNGDNLRE